ncbi:hypothetical protein [Nesterenkonia sedimenti]
MPARRQRHSPPGSGGRTLQFRRGYAYWSAGAHSLRVLSSR